MTRKLISKAKKVTENAKNELLKGKMVGARDQTFDIKLSNVLQLLKTIGDSMTLGRYIYAVIFMDAIHYYVRT